MKVPLNLRVDPVELEEIDRRAQSAGKNRTRFMVDAALGASENTDERLDGFERRLARLEEVAGL